MKKQFIVLTHDDINGYVHNDSQNEAEIFALKCADTNPGKKFFIVEIKCSIIAKRVAMDYTWDKVK